MTPFFSIIIPVYNVAPYLRECLDSVLAQTFTDWECICVDDGSTDGSGAILDEYAAKDKRFNVIHQTNAGVGAARNAALDMVKGVWVGFLDPDDMFATWHLESIYEICNRHSDATCIRTWFSVFYEDDKTLVDNGNQKKDGCSEVVFCGVEALICGWRLIAGNGVVWVIFYKHNIIVNSCRFPIGVRIREDAVFSFEMATMVNVLVVSDSNGYLHRRRMGSAQYSSRLPNDTSRLFAAMLEMFERRKGVLGDIHRSPILRQTLTFWVYKDLREWLLYCVTRTSADEKMTHQQVARLVRIGAISSEDLSVAARVRFIIYLLTGCGRVIIINRKNLTGKPEVMKTYG